MDQRLGHPTHTKLFLFLAVQLMKVNDQRPHLQSLCQSWQLPHRSGQYSTARCEEIQYYNYSFIMFYITAACVHRRKAARISSEASSFSCKSPVCAVHHRIWLQVCTSFTSHDNPMHTSTCAQTCQEIKSQKVLVFSEGRQHGSRQKPVASVANYPCVLFITEHDSKFAQVLPVMTIPCTPALCTNMSRN